MKFWILWWLVLCFISHGEALTCSEALNQTPGGCDPNNPEACMRNLNVVLRDGPREKINIGLQCMEDGLEQAPPFKQYRADKSVAMNFRLSNPPPEHFDIFASENKTTSSLYVDVSSLSTFNQDVSSLNVSSLNVSSLKVTARLPKETIVGRFPKIVFSMFFLPNMTFFSPSEELYEDRLIGLKVVEKQFSGLQERVNITMHDFTRVNEFSNPRCVFLNHSTQAFSTEGCLTLWEPGWSNITCSCDHLTFFGILLVNVQSSQANQSSQGSTILSAEDILKYTHLIGCSLSLVTLIITVLIFITNKQIRADDSNKVHISLVIALILLNVHFLPMEMVAKTSSTALCFYVALSLHYSLMAAFGWMALEGFHLYLLLVKVFNIYIKRYILKVSLVGWGVPAVIVSVVLAIDKGAYGRVVLDSSNPNSTEMCYINNETVKWVSALGVFCLVFLFNVSMFVVAVRWVLFGQSGEQFGQSDRERANKNICTLLSIMVLFGITWGPILLSFDYWSTSVLYIFCIFNSLQGFFIFLYFVLSWKKIKKSVANTSNATGSTGGKT